MAGGGGSDGDFGLQIAPMLDVLFVLLLFFMVSAGAQKHEAAISTQLPGGEPGKALLLKVTIDPNGQVSINDAPYDTAEDRGLPQTKSRLSDIVKSNPDQAVIIAPTASTKQQRVIDVLNACSAAGVKNLAYGAP